MSDTLKPKLIAGFSRGIILTTIDGKAIDHKLLMVDEAQKGITEPRPRLEVRER